MPSERELFKHFTACIGSVFKDLREKAQANDEKKSYEAFAFDHDLSRAQYHRMENGKANVTVKSVTRIVAVHKLTTEQFIELLIEKEKNLRG